jgi:hypothetical protein
MRFRSNEISIHLMAAADKEKDKEKDKGKGKKGEQPGPEQDLVGGGGDGNGGCAQTCTVGTGLVGTAKKMEALDWKQGLALLRAQLRGMLALPQ